MYLRTFYSLMSVLALCLVAVRAPAHGLWDGDDDRGWGEHARPEGKHASVRLYDARGTVVGDVVYVSGIGYDGGVVLNVKGVFVFAGISRVGNVGPGGATSASEMRWQYPQLAYSGENCSGTPYIYYERGAFRPSAIERKGTTATLYIAQDTVSQTTPIGSFGAVIGDPICIRGAPVFVSKAWPVESTLDLTQLYPEPLRIAP
ncbi:hypothetical protein AWB66_05884 [Caballeronia telluris]|uniref:Lipoprotein n=1 Tax=Caballeronia telluris TaxID=326475 RepID=A0A158KBW3_9BURK|nr:hypothetical protein AWB66_05884 [Caballeronia telluris]